MNFWDRLEKPFFVLAPMADVTDAAFRKIIAKYGKPDVMWTEFVSADGLALAPEKGRRKLMADLHFEKEERPIVAQFFTGRAENMEKAAALAAEMGFDGIDINTGCPDTSIEKQYAGAAMMKDPQRTKDVVLAAIRGAKGLPVSVKTRTGYNKDDLDSWLPHLLASGVAAITLHARTRKEMSSVPAHWDAVGRAVRLRNTINPHALILGNGDAIDLPDAKSKAELSGADGVMLGRAIFGNPWLFSSMERPKLEDRLQVLLEHVKLFEEYFVNPASSGAIKNFAIMKKHFKSYIAGPDSDAELRGSLMNSNSPGEVEGVVSAFLHAK